MTIRFIGCVLATLAPAAVRGQTRDSAGVTIVENHPVQPIPAPRAIGRLPTIELGGGLNPAEQFHEVTAAIRLQSGLLVVANQGTAEVRGVLPTGVVAWSIGQKGAGPGDFIAISGLVPYGRDSLLVFDPVLGRVSVLAVSGRCVRSIPLRMPGRRVRPVAPVMLPGRGLLGLVNNVDRMAPSPTPVVMTQSLFRFSDSLAPTLVGTFLESEFFVQEVPREVGGVAYWNLPFARQACFRVVGDRVLYGDGERFEVREYTEDGSLRRIVRLDAQAAQITERDRADAMSKDKDLAPTTEPSLLAASKRFWETVPIRKRFPVFKRFEVTRSGGLWVERYPSVNDASGFWAVFSPDGRYRGDVAIPRRLRVKSVEDDGIVAVFLDEDDVEHVAYFMLTP